MLLSGTIGWSHDATARGLWAGALVRLNGGSLVGYEGTEAAREVRGRRLAVTVLIIMAVALMIVASVKRIRPCGERGRRLEVVVGPVARNLLPATPEPQARKCRCLRGAGRVGLRGVSLTAPQIARP